MAEGEDIVVRHLLDRKVFRQDEQTLPGDLAIPFRYLLPCSERDQVPDVDLRIPFAELAEMVFIAEAKQRMEDATPPPPSQPKKRKYVNAQGDEVKGVETPSFGSEGVCSDASRDVIEPSRPKRPPRLK